jgi:hypothetical protein
MNSDFLQEAKNFRRQSKWCSILCGAATVLTVVLAKEDRLQADLSWLIMPIGGIIFALIYFSMDQHIKKYENEVSSRNQKK